MFAHNSFMSCSARFWQASHVLRYTIHPLIPSCPAVARNKKAPDILPRPRSKLTLFLTAPAELRASRDDDENRPGDAHKTHSEDAERAEEERQHFPSAAAARQPPPILFLYQ